MTKTEIKAALEEILEEVEISFRDEDVSPAVERLVKTPMTEMKSKLDDFRAVCSDSAIKAANAAKTSAEMLAAVEEIKTKVEAAIVGSPATAVRVKRALSATPTAAAGSSVVRDTLSILAQPGNAPEAGIMFLGTQGTSKTYECRRHGNTAGFDHFIEVGCSNGMEAIDLLGGVDPGRVGKGDAWKDGPIAQAYRLAGTDKVSEIESKAGAITVMLLIDEINRMPGRERSMFLNSMSPDSHIAGGIPVYKLRTGRAVLCPISGVLTEEVLFVPCQNLSIVATGNVGMEFDTYDDDPAGRERWIERSVQPDRVAIKAIIESAASSAGAGVLGGAMTPAVTTSWLMAIYDRTTKMKDDGLLRGAATIRTLTRIIQILPEKATKSDFIAAAGIIGEAWVSWDADGTRNKEQSDLLKTAINDSCK